MFLPKKDLNLLHPDFRDRTNEWLKRCRAEGIRPLITETRRTRQRQLWLWAKGRVLPKQLELQYLSYDDPKIYSMPQAKKVTWTLSSKHIAGKAFDFGFLTQDGRFTYNGPWDRCYDIAEACGMQSLYRKFRVDRPHIEAII